MDQGRQAGGDRRPAEQLVTGNGKAAFQRTRQGKNRRIWLGVVVLLALVAGFLATRGLPSATPNPPQFWVMLPTTPGRSPVSAHSSRNECVRPELGRARGRHFLASLRRQAVLEKPRLVQRAQSPGHLHPRRQRVGGLLGFGRSSSKIRPAAWAGRRFPLPVRVGTTLIPSSSRTSAGLTGGLFLPPCIWWGA